MEIVVEPKAFGQTMAGAITGPIWIRHSAGEFPGPDWHDFPVVILAWWLEALDSKAASMTFSFMDGPLEFAVAKEDANLYRMEFIERRRNGNHLHAEEFISPSALELALHIGASKVLLECSHRGWDGPDIQHLRSLVGTVLQ